MDPYVSIVMVGRNDGHGCNFLGRLQSSIDVFTELADRNSLPSELLLVDWNPPEDRAPLHHAVEFPDTEWMRHRVISVPPEIHHDLPGGEKFPLFQYRGKNVGVRRANGEFVLATNADIIPNNRLVSYIGRQDLNRDCFYRINRTDVQVPEDSTGVSVDELLSLCKKNVVKRYTEETLEIVDKFGYLLDHSGRCVRDPRFTLGLISGSIADVVRGEQTTDRPESEPRPVESLDDIHGNAAGDFFLMSREAWIEIGGYPEREENEYVDALGPILATVAGYDQVLLSDPLRIYHQEHEWDRANRPDDWRVDYSAFEETATAVLNGREPMDGNTEAWGLVDSSLQEHSMSDS